MKKLLLSYIFLILIFDAFAQSPYNTDSSDLVMVKSNSCFVYNTPHIIYNEIAQDSLLELPVGLPIKTCGYKDNYFKVNINGEEGYIFCMCVTTPKRMRETRQQLLLDIINKLHKLPKIQIFQIILITQNEQNIILDMQNFANTYTNSPLILKIIQKFIFNTSIFYIFK